ncbi:hypothetical protein GS597_03170 [Synechococcales cyanobacterium C]|uniref:Uncharacterized protein n=1 Tax=Petrachloros mirabilis ULC683 TaxID=2781853 RepID=A0A8K2AND6_9CYAN|nr:hypothetical protein [Petrachloros mirabilis]NCJ05523.1 hypothetical protein [Petrachloros mirabilis ULC683]
MKVYVFLLHLLCVKFITLLALCGASSATAIEKITAPTESLNGKKTIISQSAEDLVLEPPVARTPRPPSANDLRFPEELVPPFEPFGSPQISPPDEFEVAPEAPEQPQPDPEDPKPISTELQPSDPDSVSPISTTLPLNGATITHRTQWELEPGVNFGTDRSTNPNINALVRLHGQVREGIQDNVLIQDQRASYLQLRTFRREREVTTTTIEPVTALGIQLQLSLTGACVFPGLSSDQFCTFTPGLVTDLDSLEPATLFPTRFFVTSSIGDVVSPEDIELTRQPGFQGGLEPPIGLDLTFPNTGTTFGSSQSETTEIRRQEDFREYPVGIFSQVRQVVKANDREAVLGRTIRGLAIVAPNDNFLSSTLWHPAAWLLPDAVPRLEGGENPPNRNINRNLFTAANNTRLPTNSYTVYQGGLGRARSLELDEIRTQRDVPWGHFNSVWVGLSPVVRRSITESSALRLTGDDPTSQVGPIGAEGGGLDALEDVDINLPVVIASPDEIFQVDPTDILNFYTQVYVTAFEQDGEQTQVRRFTELTNYVPHISFSGNFTGAEDVFRYYTGLITSSDLKAYVGADYTRETPSGWRFQFAGIGYTNPDPDYFSSIEANVRKRTQLSRDFTLTFGAGLNYAIDRDTNIDQFVINNDASAVSLNAQANFRDFDFGVVGVVGDVLPNSRESSVTLTTRWQMHPYARLFAYYSPLNKNLSFSRVGAGVNLRLGRQPNHPSLNFLWSNNRYDIGLDSGGNSLTTQDHTFSVVVRFGAPANPFQAGHQAIPRQHQDMLEQLEESDPSQEESVDF